MESEQATLMDSIKDVVQKFHVGSRIQETPEEGQRAYQPK